MALTVDHDMTDFGNKWVETMLVATDADTIIKVPNRDVQVIHLGRKSVVIDDYSVAATDVLIVRDSVYDPDGDKGTFGAGTKVPIFPQGSYTFAGRRVGRDADNGGRYLLLRAVANAALVVIGVGTYNRI